MAETGEVATGLIDGGKLYQKRARRALPNPGTAGEGAQDHVLW